MQVKAVKPEQAREQMQEAANSASVPAAAEAKIAWASA